MKLFMQEAHTKNLTFWGLGTGRRQTILASFNIAISSRKQDLIRCWVANYLFLAMLISLIKKNLSRRQKLHLTASKFYSVPRSVSAVAEKQLMRQNRTKQENTASTLMHSTSRELWQTQSLNPRHAPPPALLQEDVWTQIYCIRR